MGLVLEEVGGVDLLRWEGPSGVIAAFSMRRGGVSEGPYASLNIGRSTGDDPAHVAENRRRLCAAVGADPLRTTANHQVHGSDVRPAASLPGGFATPTVSPPEADGLVTTERELALVAFAADCVPVVIAARDGSALAVVHAGWRGLVAGVLENAVGALPSGGLCAAIGPCAGPERYEVGPEVRDRLERRFGDAWGRGRLADLAGCARRALVDVGLDPAAVEVANLCTIGDPVRLFSHRRDGAPGGRQGAIAYLAA
jgi:YfiH family protein